MRKKINRSKEVIKKEMKIAEVIQKYPETMFVFGQYELHCVGCPMSLPETIEQAAQSHQADLKKFLDELNKAIKK